MTYEELSKQLIWKPSVEALPDAARTIVGGMGGSALPAYAARFLAPALPVYAHSDYDLPEDAGGDARYIAISYSGDTEETLSFAKAAHERGLTLAAISSGGALAAFANKEGIPYIEVPGGLAPRAALIYLLHALCAFIDQADLSAPLRSVSFDAAAADEEAKALATFIGGGFPVFYASRSNGFLARGAKILFNETGKAPAAANVFPELNHNEMQSYDRGAPEAAALARFVLLRDTADDARVAKRMDVFGQLMREREHPVNDLALEGASRAEMLARAWYLFHGAAKESALSRGADPDAIPLVSQFKSAL